MEDWIEYFRQEWADIIYHDHYTQLVTTLRSSLCNDQAIEDMIEKFLAELEVSFYRKKRMQIDHYFIWCCDFMVFIRMEGMKCIY